MGRLTVTCKKNDYDKCSICGANTIFKWHKVEDCLRNLEAQKMELRADLARLRELLGEVVIVGNYETRLCKIALEHLVSNTKYYRQMKAADDRFEKLLINIQSKLEEK